MFRMFFRPILVSRDSSLTDSGVLGIFGKP